MRGETRTNYAVTKQMSETVINHPASRYQSAFVTPPSLAGEAARLLPLHLDDLGVADELHVHLPLRKRRVLRNVHGLAAIHRVRTNSKHEDFCTIAPNRSHLSRAAQAGGRDNDRTGHRNYSTHELEQIPVSKLRETT